MFPLGTVLVPGMVLPLHVFEPRYRRMVDDCRAGDGTFGVVLIERGSEVGGGDVRTDVGTLARILRADELPDGRWILGALGIHRIRVEQWLPDEPYPRAEIVEWADEPGKPAGEPPDEGLSDDRVDVTMLLRRAAALSREMGEPAPPLDLELADDPVVASYQATVVAPVGPADRQALLAAPSVPARWALLHQLLVDQIDLLQARLAGG
jgi:Lon protease-like protein